MAKSLLLKVLVDVLGKYVEGLKEENLKLGVWSGKIQFFNLQLKESALDELNLPINIVRGSLKSLVVKIPWTQLESKPVEIYIDGIYALASPLDLSKFSAEDLMRMSKSAKLEKLKKIDEKIIAAFNKKIETVEETAKKASYFQQLVTHIVDNLEVNIKNIHIRYEDHLSDPKNVFALGITLDEISLSTTDEGWNVRYVKRNSDSPISGTIHKLGVLQHCGIYWNPKSFRTSEKPYDRWEEYMYTTIYRGDADFTTPDFVYILDPKNKLTLKLIHSGTATENTPNVDAVIESSTMGFNFDRFHFQQIMLVVSCFDDLEKRKEWSLHRPSLRPNVDPRAWWHYAYRLISGKELTFARKMRTMVLCLRSRDKYVNLVKMQKIKEAKNEKLDNSSQNEMKALEDSLPISALMIFREDGVKEAMVELEKSKSTKALSGKTMSSKLEEKKNEESKKSSFFSGWFSSSKKPTSPPASDSASPKKVIKEIAAETEDDEGHIMESFETRLKRIDEQSQSAVGSPFAFRLKLQSSSKLNLYFEAAPLAEMGMNLEAAVEVRYSNVMIKCGFGNVSLIDQISSHPYDPKILQLLESSETQSLDPISSGKRTSRSQFGFDLSVVQNKVGVKVKSLPLLFTWNEEFLKKLVLFFKIEESEELIRRKIGKRIVERLQEGELRNEPVHGSVVDIDIEVHAPKVVIPENPRFEERCIFLDAGYLTMKGQITSNGMKWRINLNNINIAMPASKKQILHTGDEDYLIKPFDIELHIQNEDKSVAEMNLDGAISPKIAADFDAEKIVRLVQAILLIIETFGEEKKEKAEEEVPEKSDNNDFATPSKVSANKRRSLLATPTDDRMVAKDLDMKVGKNSTVNPLNLKLSLSSFECRLNITEDHYALLKLSDLNFSFLDRPHDSIISFQLLSMVLTDSFRQQEFSSVIEAKSSKEETDYLVDGQYSIFKNSHSPDFSGFQSELHLRVADIELFIDPFTTRSYQTLMKDIIANYQTCFSQTVFAIPKGDAATFDHAEAVVSAPKHKDLKGMKLRFMLNKVGLHFLNRVQPRDEMLEIGFSFQASKLGAEIKQEGLVSGKLGLERIELVDRRRRSASLHYKTLLSYNPASMPVSNSDLNQLVDLKFFQNSTKSTIVEIQVRDLTTMISIDVIMDFVTILLANIESFMGILSQINFEDPKTAELAQLAKDSYQLSEQKPVAESENDCVVVSVAVINPNLVLLEDPSNPKSKAIAATCAVNLQFAKEIKKGHIEEVRDILHLSLQQAEVFVVLDNSTNEISHRIIDPTALEFHLHSVMMSGVNVLMDISIVAEDIFIRASLNDLVLGTAIVKRLTDRPDTDLVAEMEGGSEKSEPSIKIRRDSISIQTGITMYKFRFHLSKVQVVLINDFHGQSNPLVRVDISYSDLSFQGALVDLQGEGSATLFGDYYNSDLGIWEPLMEKWRPTLIYEQGTDGKELKIVYESFVQINVTSMLIKCVTNAVDLIGRIGEEGVYHSRVDSHPLTIRNQLGVAIDLFDGGGSEPLIHLDNDRATRIPHLSEDTKESQLVRDKEFVRTFDVKLGGEFTNGFLPIKDLRLNLHKPKVIQLQNPRGTMQRSASSYAPVVEEIYQYSRYNMLKASWEAPWKQMGDPNEWADGNGKGGKHPNSISLPSGWDWLEPDWRVDMTSSVGKEIDKDGWEYSLQFGSFGVNTKKRSKQPGDCVRRRKWIRTRYMKQEKKNGNEGILSRIVWQVVSNPDETKQIFLRSSKIVENRFSVGIEVGMESSFSDGECNQWFKVSANSENCFPLMLSEESGVRVRLQGFDSCWSDVLPLVLGKSASKEESQYRLSCCRCNDNRVVAICSSTEEKDGILRLTIAPLVQISNFLPCDIRYKGPGMLEEVTIVSGGVISTFFHQESGDTLHGIKLNQFSATVPFKFPQKGHIAEEGLSLFSRDRSSAIQLKMNLMTTSTGIHNVSVYSSLLVLDRTNLGATFLHSMAKDKNNVDWNRRTRNREVTEFINNESWIVGDAGLAMFTPLHKRFCVAFGSGSALLTDVDPTAFSTSKVSLDAVDTDLKRCYHVAVKADPYPVAADLCSVLTFMPAFHIVNATKKELFFVQREADFDANAIFSIPAESTAPFHGLIPKRDTNAFFKAEGSEWSLGAVNLNEIGTSSFTLATSNNNEDRPHIFLNIDVRLSASEEHSYLTAVIWESKIWKDPITLKTYREGNVIYSIRNLSHVPLTMIQSKINIQDRLRGMHGANLKDGGDDNDWAMVVMPGVWQPFGYLDPDVGDEFTFFIGTSLIHTVGNPVRLRLNKVGESVHLRSDPENIRLLLQVKANANGKMIVVKDMTIADVALFEKESESSSRKSFDDLRQNDLVLRLSLAAFTVSVIADKPSRRELFALALKKIYFELRQISETKDENGATLVLFNLSDIQIDNFTETAVYPVLLRSDRNWQDEPDDRSNEPLKKAAAKGAEFITYSMVVEYPKDQSSPVIRYVAFRMLEMYVAVDSASVLVAASDLLSFVSAAEMSQEKFALENSEHFNASMSRLLLSNQLNDVNYQYKSSQNQKLFFENLIIHPMKLILDFYPNHFPRKRREIPPAMRWLTSLESITAVENFNVRIKSFIAENAMESVPSLAQRIGNKILRDIQGDLVQIAGNLIGSLNLIGNPVGLYKNIGSSVQDFFYEPYTGLMNSPTDFVKGLGKGTKGLLTGVAGGVVSSAANIVGSATGGVSSVAKGVATITGDDKFLKRREEKRRELKANQGGVLEGFRAGGESVLTGFSSGFAGLVKRPYEEGQKSGAVGFFKGLGQGIVGVAVKPVIGISEGISSVVQGINQQVSDTPGMQHIRPARAFYRRDQVDDCMILVPLDFFAAAAQRFVKNRAGTKDYSDSYLCSMSLGYNVATMREDASVGFVLSERLFVVLTKAFREKWSVPVPSISFVQLIRDSDNYGLRIHTYESSGAFSHRQIIFANQKAAKEGYDSLYRFRFCFGKPTEMLPPDEASDAANREDAGVGFSGRAEAERGVGEGREVQNKIAHYEFGHANKMDVRIDKMENVSDSEFNGRYTYMLKQFQVSLPIQPEDEYGYHKLLDDILWRIVSNWTKNHDSIINPSRCCGCLIINYSSVEVQILETLLKEGADVATFGVGGGYYPGARSIEPFGGAAIVFATGRRPTLVSLEHVKVVIRTSAFRAMVATRENRSTCESFAGFNTVFLEKSRTDWWAKYVICIK